MKPLTKDGRSDPYWMLENQEGIVKVSYWSLSEYRRCPGKYEYITLAPKVTVPADKRNAVVGSVEHSILEDYYRDGVFEPIDFGSKARSVLEKFLEKEHVEWKSDDDKEQVIREIKDDLTTTFGVLRSENLLREAATPEKTVSGKLTEHILLRGRIDLYIEDDDPTVIDHKAVKSESSSSVDKKQLVFYKMLLRAAGLPVPEKLGWYLTKFDKIKWANVTSKDEDKLRQDILDAVEGIKAREFSYKPHRIFCQWCDFSSMCPAFKRKFPNQGLFNAVKKMDVQGEVEF